MSNKEPALRKISGLANNIRIGMILSIVLNGMVILNELISCMIGPAPLTVENMDVAHIVNGLGALALAVFSLILVIVNATMVCMWMHRASSNLRFVGVPGMKFFPGDAINNWFIPFANLIRPYQIMLEIAFASDPEVQADDANPFIKMKAPPVFRMWWFSWILAGVMGNLSFQLARTVPDGFAFYGAAIACDALSIGSALAFMSIVRSITAKQEAKIPELRDLVG